MLRTREGREFLLRRGSHQVVQTEVIQFDEIVDVEQIWLTLTLFDARYGALTHTDFPADVSLCESESLPCALQAQPEHPVALTVLWSRHT